LDELNYLLAAAWADDDEAEQRELYREYLALWHFFENPDREADRRAIVAAGGTPIAYVQPIDQTTKAANVSPPRHAHWEDTPIMHTDSTATTIPIDPFAVWTIEVDLRLSQLEINAEYQRPIRQPWVKKLVREFDPALLGKLRVAERNGRYYVIDGQHRLEALRVLAAGVDRFVRCDVQIVESAHDEARLFVLLNQSRAPLHGSEVMRARLAAGDPSAFGIKTAMERFGYQLSLARGGRPPLGQCNAYALLDVIYGTPKIGMRGSDRAGTPGGSPDLLDEVLAVFRSAYGNGRYLGATTLGTIYRLLRRYPGDACDRKRLAMILSKLDLEDGPEIPAMQQAFGMKSRDYAGVAAVVRRYNTRIVEAKRLPMDMAA